MLPRTRLTFALAALGLIIAAFTLRWPALGLPWVVGKFGGATLWGAMVYCVAALIIPRAPRLAVFLFAAVTALSVEFSQLIHVDWLDAIRRTTIGVILIGRYFSWGDAAAYLGGITLAVLADRMAIRSA
jgi:phage shock protein PspC (stress-responsive transcriptional regulator)